MPDLELAVAPQGIDLQPDQNTRLLWTHAAYQVISALPADAPYERVPVGAGWGLRHPDYLSRTVVLHPSTSGQGIGDLSLTISGSGTHIIPRCGRGYIEYLDAVIDIVETTARGFLCSAIPARIFHSTPHS